MIYSDLRAFTTSVTNRPELDVLQTGETITRLQRALQAAHTSLQQDELVDGSFGTPVRMIPDWQAQQFTNGDVNTPVVYPVNSSGIDVTTLPATGATLKRITNVKEIRTVINQAFYTPIDPATKTEIEWFARGEHDEFGNLQVPREMYHQRWFVYQGLLRLLFVTNRNNTNFNLQVELLQLLPFYDEDTDHDFFSDTLWQTLAFGGAYYGFMFIGETEDAASMKALFEESAIKALRADRRNWQGGTAGVHRPPLATGRRY